MLVAVLRDAVAGVPSVHRRPVIDGEVERVGERLHQLPWKVADATPAQRERALGELVAVLAEGVDLAWTIRRVPGYQSVAAALYGLVAGIVGAPPSEAAQEAPAAPGEPLAARNGAREGQPAVTEGAHGA